MIIRYILLCLIFFSNFAYSNKVSIFFDNDFPFNTDRYYTHGWGIKHNSEILDSSRYLNYFSIFKNSIINEISLNQQIFTPDNRETSEILEADYPYSGLIFIKFSNFSASNNNWLIYSEYSLGIIGDIAMAKETQEAIHSLTPSSFNPKGWHNQLQNDLIVNADYSLQKEILNLPVIEFYGLGQAGAGTLNNYAGIGLSVQKYFEIIEYLHFAYSLSDFYTASIYDTRLRGTVLFNSESALSSDKIENFYNTLNLSLYLKVYKVGLNFAYTYISKQIKTGFNHQYFTFQIGLEY
jgi:hypothetical protein